MKTQQSARHLCFIAADYFYYVIQWAKLVKDDGSIDLLALEVKQPFCNRFEKCIGEDHQLRQT